MKRIYALDLIQTAKVCFKEYGKYYPLRQFLPYCLYKFGDNWLPLNRDYKPLGILNGDFVNYTEYTFLYIPDPLLNIQKLEIEKDGLRPDVPGVWLYKDSTSPCINKKMRTRYCDLIEDVFFQEYP